MSSRRHTRDPSTANTDLLSAEARRQLEHWPEEEQRVLIEVLEDAGSELQREFLRRALAAGHEPAELHAFADDIRALSDEALFEACTVSHRPAAPLPPSVVMQLRAQSDPLYAYKLNGHALAPSKVSGAVSSVPIAVPSSPETGNGPPAVEYGESASRAPVRRDLNDLGRSPEPQQPRAAAKAAPGEELINEAVRGLGLRYREELVDTASMPLEKALVAAASALSRGVLIPVVLGKEQGDLRRYAMLMQVLSTGKTRAFQLYDPMTFELIWVNEGDLLARAELPLADKAVKRITAMALPREGPKL